MAYDAQSSEGREHAEQLMRIQEQMEAERATLDGLYEQIAGLLFPRAQQFTSRDLQEGRLRGERVFDNTPGLALDRFAAAIGSLLVPETDQYHGLAPADPDLADDEEIKKWCEVATDTLFAVRYAPRANFSAQFHEYLLSLGAFGAGAIFVDDDTGRGVRYRSMHLSEIYFGENFQGRIDRVHRGRFQLAAYQAAQMFDPISLPECIKKALADPKRQRDKFEFIHCVYPNDQVDPRRLDVAGMAFRSHYVSIEGRAIVLERGRDGAGVERGYRSMPYAAGRYVTGPREIYGRSPAMTVLRDILTLNQMNKDLVRAGQFHNEPPILLSEDGALAPFQMRPGAINGGYLTSDGEALAQFMTPQGNLPITLEMIQDRRRTVNDAFFITLFQILVQNPNQTATEALLRAQEKGQLLGPSIGRQQSEVLGTIIERELDILSMAGQLPDMPEALLASGGVVQVQYRSPLNRLQKTGAAVGVLRVIEGMQALAQIDPSIIHDIDAGVGLRALAEANAAPEGFIRSAEEAAARREEEDQTRAAQELAKAAPLIGRTVKDIAQAQSVAGNSPPAIPYVQPAGA